MLEYRMRLAPALYWKDFGDLPKADFENACGNRLVGSLPPSVGDAAKKDDLRALWRDKAN